MKNIVVRVNYRQWIYIMPISNGSVNPFKRKDVDQNASEPNQFNMQMCLIKMQTPSLSTHIFCHDLQTAWMAIKCKCKFKKYMPQVEKMHRPRYMRH